MLYSSYGSGIHMGYCLYADTYFLCEEDETPEQTYTSQNGAPGRRRIVLSQLSNSSAPVPHVICPSGHWTHELLACDVKSACWQHGQPGDSSGRGTRSMTSLCQSPLSVLFTCRNGVGHVPYSLVCDHSQDCLDFSDEDFCVHPSCSGSWQFECVSKQVRHTSHIVFGLYLV